MIPVVNHPNLARDPKTSAIINQDQSLYQQRLAVLETKKKQDHEIDVLKTELANLQTIIQQLQSYYKGDMK